MSSGVNRLMEDGWDETRKGLFANSALYFEDAYRLSLEIGDNNLSIQSAFWASNSWAYAGKLLNAMGILSSALVYFESAGIKDRWYLRCKERYWNLILDFFPEIGKLTSYLEEIKILSFDVYPNLSRYYCLKASLLSKCGEWEKALEFRERGWSMFDKSFDFNFMRFSEASTMSETLLRIGDINAAKEWHEKINIDSNEESNIRNIEWIVNLIKIKLFEKNYVDINLLVSGLEDYCASIQSINTFQQAQNLITRVYLLKSEIGDPQQSSHPSRNRLARRPTGNLELEEYFNLYLLRVDYRLACLRYLLNMDPCEDLWYRDEAESVGKNNTIVNVDEYDFRIKKVENAFNFVKQFAEYLDKCFLCDWRQKMVVNRSERFDKIREIYEKEYY